VHALAARQFMTADQIDGLTLQGTPTTTPCEILKVLQLTTAGWRAGGGRRPPQLVSQPAAVPTLQRLWQRRAGRDVGDAGTAPLIVPLPKVQGPCLYGNDRFPESVR
jgi:hypothetical protein